MGRGGWTWFLPTLPLNNSAIIRVPDNLALVTSNDPPSSSWGAAVAEMHPVMEIQTLFGLTSSAGHHIKRPDLFPAVRAFFVPPELNLQSELYNGAECLR